MPITRRHTALLLLLTALAAPAAAQDRPPADSSAPWPLDEVVVAADRFPVPPGGSGAVRRDIAPGEGWRFGDAGAELAAAGNLHLASYGGGRPLRTMSIRGMGSEHTLVLWHGIPAGNLQTGVPDLSLIDAADLGGIRITSGGSSSFHGSGAVGGTVNLIPAFPFGAGKELEMAATTGSFGRSGWSARAAASPAPSLGLSLRAGRVRGRGDFAAPGPGGGEAPLANGDHLMTTASALAGWMPGARHRAGLLLSALDLDQGSPGPVGAGAGSPAARRNDRRYLAGLVAYGGDGRGGEYSAGTLVDAQEERYTDPRTGSGVDNRYRTTWVGVTARGRRRVGAAVAATTALDAGYARSAGNAVEGGVRTERLGSWSAALAWMRGITLSLSARYDVSSSAAPRLSPGAGLQADLPAGGGVFRLHGTAGTGRREPTVNERYYAGEGGKGNPLIRGESSVSFDAGVGGEHPAGPGSFVWDLTWYRISMADRIQWIPTENPRIWSPRNLARTRSTGWELSGRWSLPGERMAVVANYSTIDSKVGESNVDGSIVYERHLINVPLDKGAVGIWMDLPLHRRPFRSFGGSVRLVYTGERYLTDDNAVSRSGHLLIEGSFRVEIDAPGGRCLLLYEGRNIGDVRYETVPGYPMPGISNDLTLLYTITF